VRDASVAKRVVVLKVRAKARTRSYLRSKLLWGGFRAPARCTRLGIAGYAGGTAL